jgi:hypothetical protein
MQHGDKSRKAFKYARTYRMTREERLEFGSMILRDRPPLTTWDGLTEEDFVRLLDAFEGHALLSQLLSSRPQGQSR